jgi:hypothetical protein
MDEKSLDDKTEEESAGCSNGCVEVGVGDGLDSGAGDEATSCRRSGRVFRLLHPSIYLSRASTVA